MANPYTMPSPQAPFVDPANGAITQVWLGLMREYMKGLKAERAPGRIEPFELSAADLADDTKFVQAGVTAGLGVGDYLGWALCNGNNGTVDRNGYFIHGSTVAAGTVVGNNDSSHVHDRGAHQHAAGTLAGPSHTHGAGTICAEISTAGAVFFWNSVATISNWISSYKVNAAGGGADATTYGYGAQCLGNTAAGGTGAVTGSTAIDGAGNTGAASATDNRPLSMSVVFLMRVP